MEIAVLREGLSHLLGCRKEKTGSCESVFLGVKEFDHLMVGAFSIEMNILKGYKAVFSVHFEYFGICAFTVKKHKATTNLFIYRIDFFCSNSENIGEMHWVFFCW